MILLKIAFRNLREHKIKTLIIGSLIALGIAFLVIGNSVMESITKGMQQSYVENFTGDLILRNTSEEEVSFFPGFAGSPNVIKNYTKITQDLASQEAIKAYTPLLTGAASINKNDETLSFALLWGIEPSSYLDMFPDSFELTSGEFLKEGEQGIVLAQSVIDDVLAEHDLTLKPGDHILLSGQNNITGTKIREVTIRGIGQYENAAGPLERISFVDASTLRALNGLTAIQVDKTNTLTDLAINDEALFGSALITTEDKSSSNELDFDNILGDTSLRDEYLSLDNNAWHYLLLEVDDGKLASAQSQLVNTERETLVIETWRWGAGFIAELAYGIRNILNIVILVIAIVAIIIIMNTLVISVTERIAEIGTIRAIGGQRMFIRRMITTEVLLITLVFGILGMSLGGLIIGIFNVVGLSASNLFLQVLFGGPVLKPILSVSSLFFSLLIVAIIGLIASLYPTSVALGITPVQAMQKQ